MRVPILRHASNLIASVQSDLSDGEVLQLRDELVREVGRHRSKGVVVDVRGMDIIDSFTARSFRSIAEAARLRGARTIIVGIRPEVAIAMVHFDVDLAPLETALDLEEALTLLADSDHRDVAYVR
jgi:rsbT antagonist protein RsbS